jgi:hypothetical protein
MARNLGKRDGYKAIVAICILMDTLSDDQLDFDEELRVLSFRRDLRNAWKKWAKKEFNGDWRAFVNDADKVGEYSIREMGFPPEEPTDEAAYLLALKEIVGRHAGEVGVSTSTSKKLRRAAPRRS